MKRMTFWAWCLGIVILSSCSKSDEIKDIQCEGECLFALTDTRGVVVELQCFETYGIKITRQNDGLEEIIYGIPDDLDGQFKVIDKEVVVSAAFRTNTLEPRFPDPSIDMAQLYQIELVAISSAQ